MRKVYLEIDEPKSCGDCPFLVSSLGETCGVTGETIEERFAGQRLPFCPLKEA